MPAGLDLRLAKDGMSIIRKMKRLMSSDMKSLTIKTQIDIEGDIKK